MSSWVSYLCQVNGNLSSIQVDMELESRAPDRARPHLLFVWVEMRQPRSDGLSSEEEFQRLGAVEDALTRGLEAGCRAVLAGAITGDRRREFYYYAAHAKEIDRAVRSCLEPWSDYEFRIGEQPDPAWRQYFDVLYPSADQRQRILNRRVLEQLQQRGDNPSIEREIRHWIYFCSASDRQAFLEWTRESGWSADAEAFRSPGPDPGSFPILVTRRHSTVPEIVDSEVLQVFHAAQRFRGRYDGWETCVE